MGGLPTLVDAAVTAFSVLGGVMAAWSGYLAQRALAYGHRAEDLGPVINQGIADDSSGAPGQRSSPLSSHLVARVNPQRDRRIVNVAGFLTATTTGAGIVLFDWPSVLAFAVPFFGGLLFLATRESFRDGILSRMLR